MNAIKTMFMAPGKAWSPSQGLRKNTNSALTGEEKWRAIAEIIFTIPNITNIHRKASQSKKLNRILKI